MLRPDARGLNSPPRFQMTTYTYTTIDPPGSTYTIANSINAKGQIVGFYEGGSNGSITSEHAFLYNGGGGIYTTIDPPGSLGNPTADSINNAGQIVGYYPFAGGTEHGFLATHSVGHTAVNGHTDVLGIHLGLTNALSSRLIFGAINLTSSESKTPCPEQLGGFFLVFAST
jgi:probable HAF family extracellular repeat protein